MRWAFGERNRAGTLAFRGQVAVQSSIELRILRLSLAQLCFFCFMIFSMAKDEIHELPLAIQQKNTSKILLELFRYQLLDPYPYWSMAVANHVPSGNDSHSYGKWPIDSGFTH